MQTHRQDEITATQKEYEETQARLEELLKYQPSKLFGEDVYVKGSLSITPNFYLLSVAELKFRLTQLEAKLQAFSPTQEPEQKPVTGSEEQPKLSYRQLLEKTILDEWGSEGRIRILTGDTLIGGPYSTEIYEIEKKFVKGPNFSHEGAHFRSKLLSQINQHCQRMRAFENDPKKFSTEELEALRKDIISTHSEVIRAGGYFHDLDVRSRAKIDLNTELLDKCARSQSSESKLGLQ